MFDVILITKGNLFGEVMRHSINPTSINDLIGSDLIGIRITCLHDYQASIRRA